MGPPGARHTRQATWSESEPNGRFRAYELTEHLQRDKVSLDLFWLRDDSLEDSTNLPEPHLLSAEIAEDFRASIEQIEEVLAELRRRS